EPIAEATELCCGTLFLCIEIGHVASNRPKVVKSEIKAFRRTNDKTGSFQLPICPFKARICINNE
ncbi:hypothetical protein MUP38_08155, partial [Candidatus Bathyarchaeota archaeon]|nr:hypothetical protein [Candidatus Bathyarchaeota archaeon]